MKKLITFSILGAFCLGPALAGGLEERAAAARATAKAFMQSLKGELMQAMQAGGPTNAIAVCNTRAPEIAGTFSAQRGWDVGRTSLKLRNPENAPDKWERQVLERFEARKAAGEDPAKMEHFEVVQQEGKSVFRYMKAIPTAQLCTTCHGGKLAPAVASKLDELYPEDRARGFREGDIRGAFTISQPM